MGLTEWGVSKHVQAFIQKLVCFSHVRACLPPQPLWIQYYYVKPSYVPRSMSNSAYYFQCSYWIQILLNRLFPLSMRKQTFAFPKKNIVFVKWGSNFPTKPSLQGFLIKWLMNAYLLIKLIQHAIAICWRRGNLIFTFLGSWSYQMFVVFLFGFQ